MKLLFLSGYLSPVIIQAVCRTLLHSLWQGLLAAALAGIIILATKRSKAAIRYNLLSFVFISFIFCSAFTFLNQPGVLHSTNTGGIVHFSASANTFSFAANNNNNYWLPAIEKGKFYQPVIYYADKYAGLITGLWMLFFGIHILRMLAGLHYVHRIRNYQVAEPAGEWKQRVNEMSKMLGIRRVVSLMESALVKVPVVTGTLKPLILVPLGMIANLSAEHVETILLHELAHVRRKDFAINLLQRVAEAFFFFNPFIAWLSARIREEREACCDDIVMEYTADKRSYLEALVSFRQPGAQAYGHAMALGQNNNLLYRVKRMITQENKKLNAMEKLTLILVLMAFGALSFMPAGKATGKKKDDATQPVVTKMEKQKQVTAPVKKNNDLPEQKQINDTLPEQKPIEFSNISTNINDEGTTKKEEVTAKTKNGKTYTYLLVNNEIVEMTVNGEKVKKENFHRYDGIVDQIEASRKESINKSLLDQKRNTAQLLEKQELLNKQLMDLQNKQNLLRQNDLDKAIKEQQQLGRNDELALSLMQNKLLLEKQNNSNLLKLQLENQQLMNQKLALQDKERQDLLEHKNAQELLNNHQFELKNKLALIQDEKFHGSNYELSQIVAELGEAGVVNDEKNFSFTLDNNELVVDGKKQSSDLHESLRNKHIKHKKDYFKYKAKENSRSTDIYVE